MVAKRLAEEGVAAFVLKYRVSQTPDDPAQLLAVIRKMFSGAAAKTPGAAAKPFEPPAPFATEGLAAEDAAQAVRLVRQRAAEWGVDPNRVGFLGFSAGAITATNIAIGDKAARPDFVGVIYGALRGTVPADAPPAFIAASADDPLLSGAACPMYQAWRSAGVAAELHVFERGGHGYGLVPQGTSSDHWMDEFVWWMKARNLLKANRD